MTLRNWRESFEIVCQTAQGILAEVLENLDQGLNGARDKKKYRNKGKRTRIIKTLMGEVEYSRTAYEMTDDDRAKAYMYLLDQVL